MLENVVMEQRQMREIEEGHVQDMVVCVIGMMLFMKIIENMNNMEKDLFQKRPIKLKSFFQKIFRQKPIENPIIELNNLFASMNIDEIEPNAIKEIEDKYKISFIEDYKLNTLEFYAVYLNFFSSDPGINNEGLIKMDKLCKLLGIDKNDKQTIDDEFHRTN